MNVKPRVGPRASAPSVARATESLRRSALLAASLPVASVVAWAAFMGIGSRSPILRVAGASIELLGALLVVTGLHFVAAWYQARDRSSLVRVHGTSAVICIVLASMSGAALVSLGAIVTVGMAVGSLGVSAAADARDRVARAVRTRPLPDEAPDVHARRGWSAARIFVPAILIALVLGPLIQWSPPSHGSDDGGRSRRGRGGASPNGTDGSSGAGGSGIIVDPSAPGGRSPWVSQDVLIEVTPQRGDEPTGRIGAIYMRGTVLDRFDDSGRWIESAVKPAIVRDSEDGVRDGWCTIAPPPPRDEALTLVVRQTTMAHGASNGCVLHAPSSVSAVERDEIVHARHGVILDELRDVDRIEYSLLWTRPDRLPEPTDRTKFGTGGPRGLDLPRGGHVVAAVEALVREAERVTDGSTTDLAIVRAVCNHLRSEYRYEKIEGATSGASALGAFVEERHGTCVQFAEAACVMLRSRGVPARIASGFLVREWIASRSTYVGRGTDYHAWIEVPFNGCGWVPFDPTPLDATAVQEIPDEDAGLGGGVNSIAESIDEAVGTIADLVRENPWVLVISILGVAWVLKRLSRVPAAESEAESDEVPWVPSPAWERLLRALARRGLVRAQSQTAREFAALVVATIGASAAPFADLTERQQAARFGRIPAAPADEAAMAALADSLGG